MAARSSAGAWQTPPWPFVGTMQAELGCCEVGVPCCSGGRPAPPPCPPTFCSLLRMLRAHLGAEELVETEPGCPEDGRARPQPETVAGRSPEDGGAEAMLVSGAQA